MEIDNEIKNNLSNLEKKLVVHMTGLDLFTIVRAAVATDPTLANVPIVRCTGIHELAEHLGCCESTIYKLRREGVLDGAIISHIGKKFVFDVTKARAAAAQYSQYSKNNK